MIFSTASVYKATTWADGRETLLDDMRLRLTKRATIHGEELGGVEMIEIVPIKRDDNPHSVRERWVSSTEDSATHYMVTIEQETL